MWASATHVRLRSPFPGVARTRLRVPLVAVVVALMALPAAAQAQTLYDDYAGAYQINQPGEPLLGTGADRSAFNDALDTTGFTHQQDLFNPPGSGGPPERTS